VSAGVPTIWNDLFLYGETHEIDLSSLRWITAGGSAVPRVLMERFEQRYGLRIVQGWGMTETSPVASAGLVPVGVEGEAQWPYRGTQGRLLCGVEGRIVGDDGSTRPWDGTSVGELEVRGPWVTGSYYHPEDVKDAEEKFHDGWLRTGDVGHLDQLGYITLSDRAKDVIKSGGEWISSVDQENALMGHPDVVEAAVVGIPDEKWQERPLATVVVREGAAVTPEQLRDHLSQTFAKWQLPDAWAFVDQVPRTSVGKFDKKVVRQGFAEGRYDVRRVTG
jgi:fatty-acyl-CoA synthase